ncbi:MAG TPA: alpha/beta hydrolase [Acidimicrobiales bacterium]
MRRVAVLLVTALSVTVACAGRSQPDVSSQPEVTDTADSAAPTTSAPTPATDAPTTTVAATTTTVPGTPLPSVAWASCGEGLECGTLTVLLDHADPSKGTIDLYVERRPARKPDQRIGSLLVNPGGPGVAGTVLAEQASFYFSDALRDRFDIVAWDPRGTGRSIPVDCVDDLDPSLIGQDPTPDSPEEVQQLADTDAAFVAACATRSGALLPYISTQATARDMDSLRQALGEAKVSYFGLSYGSELGATWATMFPDTVRAAVLDGAANPDAGWEADQTAQAVGLERGLIAALQSCAADPGCPFYNGGDPLTAFETLSASLDAAPVTADPTRPPANQSLLMYATGSTLYDSAHWDDLYRALADAQAGDVRRLFALYDAYVRRAPDGSFSNTIDAFSSIGCLDDPGPADPAEFPAIDARIRAAAPHMGIGFGYPYVCAGWPAGLASPVRLTAAGAGPVLVVGTTGDAITPIESSRGLAAALEQGVLLTVEGFRHTGYGLNKCSQQTVDAYLIDQTVPAEGTVCS